MEAADGGNKVVGLEDIVGQGRECEVKVVGDAAFEARRQADAALEAVGVDEKAGEGGVSNV